MQVFVLYHYPCVDGLFAAFAAHLRFRSLPSISKVTFVPHATFKPLEVQSQLINKRSEVFLLDYCGEPSLIPGLSSSCHRVVLIDHHKTAAEVFSLASFFALFFFSLSVFAKSVVV